VALGPFDLHRLPRACGVPWQMLFRVEPSREGLIALDDERRVTLYLRQRPDGACLLRLELPSGHMRCGVWDDRPSSCRVYPFHVELFADDYLVQLGAQAACPTDASHVLSRLAGATRVDEEVGERALGQRVLKRWDAARREVDRPIEIRDFLAWNDRLHDVLAALRTGDRSGWQLDAYNVVDAFPLGLS
jgi:hypothetical protein